MKKSRPHIVKENLDSGLIFTKAPVPVLQGSKDLVVTSFQHKSAHDGHPTVFSEHLRAHCSNTIKYLQQCTLTMQLILVDALDTESQWLGRLGRLGLCQYPVPTVAMVLSLADAPIASQ